MTISKDQLVVAEAHLYVGVAKADGAVSRKEYAQIPYYADRAMAFFEKTHLPEATGKRLGKAIRDIFNNPEQKAWSSEQHLESASTTLQAAHNEGSWNVKLIMFRNERGFLDAAKIDGYVVKEANFIRKMEETLGEIFQHQED